MRGGADGAGVVDGVAERERVDVRDGVCERDALVEGVRVAEGVNPAVTQRCVAPTPGAATYPIAHPVALMVSVSYLTVAASTLFRTESNRKLQHTRLPTPLLSKVFGNENFRVPFNGRETEGFSVKSILVQLGPVMVATSDKTGSLLRYNCESKPTKPKYALHETEE